MSTITRVQFLQTDSRWCQFVAPRRYDHVGYSLEHSCSLNVHKPSNRNAYSDKVEVLALDMIEDLLGYPGATLGVNKRNYFCSRFHIAQQF